MEVVAAACHRWRFAAAGREPNFGLSCALLEHCARHGGAGLVFHQQGEEGRVPVRRPGVHLKDYRAAQSKAETYEFNKRSGLFVWERRTLISVKRKEFWLSDIQSVSVVELSDGQGGGDPNLYLMLTDGTKIKIFSGQLLTVKDRSRIVAQKQILQFLSDNRAAPASDTPPPSEADTSMRSGQMQRRITGILGRGRRQQRAETPEAVELDTLNETL